MTPICPGPNARRRVDAAAAVAGVSLLSKDPTVFVLGGGMIVALSWWHRHANHYDAAIGMIGQSGMATGKTAATA
jgi:hypothetical protein